MNHLRPQASCPPIGLPAGPQWVFSLLYFKIHMFYPGQPRIQGHSQILDWPGAMQRRNESLHQNSNDTGVRIINNATSKILVFKSTMFLHQNSHKYNWTSPDGKTHNQIDHILIDRRWHSSILDVWCIRGDDCATDHYLVVEKFRERLAVSKQAAQKFYGERFNLRKLNVL